MTQRDKTTLVYLFGGIVGVACLVWATTMWFILPLNRYHQQLKALDVDIERLEKTIGQLQVDKNKLRNYYKFLSLPPAPDKAATEYNKFLNRLLRESGLTLDDLHGPPPGEIKPPPPAVGAPKKALHQPLTFRVRAKGTVENLVVALGKMRAAPLAHRVSNLTLDRLDLKDPKARLGIQMTIEALIVNKADARDGYIAPEQRLAIIDALSGRMGGPIGLAMAVWATSPLGPRGGDLLAVKDIDRNYATIHKKNIFLGYVPPPPPEKIVKIEPKEEPDDPPDDPPVEPKIDPFDMRGQIRLVSTDPENKEAFLRNWAVKEREIRLGPKIGYNSFKIMNEERSKTLVEAKLLRIDQGNVYFMVKDDELGIYFIYGWHIGHDLKQAMARSLTDVQLEQLSLLEFMPKEEKKKDTKKKDDKKKDTNKKERPKL